MTACLIIGCRKLAFYDYKLIFAMTIKNFGRLIPKICYVEK